MSDVPAELVEKAATRLREGFLWPPGIRHEVLARAVLAVVLPDVRRATARAVAEEIATALEAERPDIGPDAYPTLGVPGALDAFARARTLNEAAFIARFAGGAPLGARYDEPGAVDDMWAALARARERHAETARVAREAGERP